MRVLLGLAPQGLDLIKLLFIIILCAPSVGLSNHQVVIAKTSIGTSTW